MAQSNGLAKVMPPGELLPPPDAADVQVERKESMQELVRRLDDLFQMVEDAAEQGEDVR